VGIPLRYRRSQRRPDLRPALILLSVLAGACAPIPPHLPEPMGSGELLSGRVFFPDSPVPELDDPQLLTLTDDMRAFVHDRTASAKTDKQRIRAILQGIWEEGSTTLQYNLVKTYSAQDVFEAKEGNCLSFTNLFIAMAREAGLDAYYQRVDIPPTWDEAGGTYIFNLHINAVVETAPFGKTAVDFDVSNFSTEYHMWRVSDEEAEAQFHNNMGAHLMTTEDRATAFLHFRQAIEISPNRGYFWTNLGTLYRRAGHEDYAEQAFLKAVELSSEPAALSNLALMYRDQGMTEVSNYYIDRVSSYHSKNPFYQYQLAEQAYSEQDFNKTNQFLKQALRLKKDDHRFYQLLALSHLQTGDVAGAQKNFSKAALHAGTTGEREKYNHKSELLRRAQ
jgi:Flp pilus assembly protein TadD